MTPREIACDKKTPTNIEKLLAHYKLVLLAELMIGGDCLLKMLARVVLGLLANIEMRHRAVIPHHAGPYLALRPLCVSCCLLRRVVRHKFVS